MHQLLMTSSESEDHSDQEYAPRRNKVFRPRINFENFEGFEFKERFRMAFDEVEFVLQKIGHHLRHPTSQNQALTPKQQLLTTLHWLGNGGQYHLTSDAHGLSKATVCRAVHRVVDTIVNHLFQDVVKWPEDNSELAAKFMKFGGFPNVCGLADGTLILIDTPHENEAAFVDRNGDHSINTLGVCGPDYTFYFISSRWPGAVSDSRVIRNSQVSQRFEDGWRPFPNAVILGDSAYGLKEWLIPPFHGNGSTVAEVTFNRSHKTTRRVIENAFGILKERFPCLNHLRVCPTFAGKIIMACATFHNIASKEDFEWTRTPNLTVSPQNQPQGPPSAAALSRLQELIEYFN